MYGVNAVTKFTEVIQEHFLDRLENLDKIKIVAGNHDRVTSSKDEDTEGGAAYLVAWGLKLLKYDVEFSPRVLTHVVGDICYILNHGHLGCVMIMECKVSLTSLWRGIYIPGYKN
jgi:hypothetical protein